MSRQVEDDYLELARTCRRWWRNLNALDKDGKPIVIGGAEKPRDRAALAQLRRIDVIDDDGTPIVDVGGALGIPAFRNLIHSLRTSLAERKLSNARVAYWLSDDCPFMEPFAIAASAISRFRNDSGDKSEKRGATARLLGKPRSEGAGDDDHLFAEARFKQLIRTRNDWPGLMRQSRRIAAILEREAPIGDLSASLILWNASPHVTRDWAFQYYQREFEPPESGEDNITSPTSANT